MSNILQFQDFQKRSGLKLEKKEGYNLPFARIIINYFEHARGIGHGAFVIKRYTNSGDSTELLRGYIPPDEFLQLNDLYKKQESLAKKLDEESGEAIDRLLSDPYTLHQWGDDAGNSVIFVACRNGVIGCGWYDSTKIKSSKMAAFLLYALGFINEDEDEKLWEVTYSCLPYNSNLGRSDVADKIILESFYDEAKERILTEVTTKTD